MSLWQNTNNGEVFWKNQEEQPVKAGDWVFVHPAVWAADGNSISSFMAQIEQIDYNYTFFKRADGMIESYPNNMFQYVRLLTRDEIIMAMLESGAK